MRKEYIMPQTQAQIIIAGQIICTSLNPTIQKGDILNGGPDGMYVG